MPNVTIATYPNLHCHSYNTKVQLTEQKQECSGNDNLGAIGELISSFPGVTSVLVERYRIMVSKGEAWDWSEVEPAIVEFLEGLHKEFGNA